MPPLQKFSDLLDAVDNLSPEEKEAFLEVLQRRYIDERREEIAAEIQAARQEFLAGECQPVTADDLMKEIVRVGCVPCTITGRLDKSGA